MKHAAPRRLDPRLYSPAQCLAASGGLPADHPAWKFSAKDEERYIAGLAEVVSPVVPELPVVVRGPIVTGAGTVRGWCSKCDSRWTGELACHCGSCHLTFRSVTGFDEHRYHGRCRTAEELRERGMEPNEAGHWRKPRPPETLPGQP